MFLIPGRFFCIWLSICWISRRPFWWS